ncbi:hypothetical protein ACIBH1_12155 [Nonomuraea sp. NPDC050663]|uniref:hypothetical protein n=1 Tax=Nonomuraea sp. NPDC050663 TaxID=3364370 RepID=UPI003799D294
MSLVRLECTADHSRSRARTCGLRWIASSSSSAWTSAIRHRKKSAKLTLTELDAAIGAFLTGTYNNRVHGETSLAPQARWEAGGFLPMDARVPRTTRPVAAHRCEIPQDPHRRNSVRVGALPLPRPGPLCSAQTTIRYDPRDIAEIRVYLRGSTGDEEYLCRAICPELSDQTVSLKDITAARNARRKEQRGTLKGRTAVVDRLIAAHTPEPPGLALESPYPLDPAQPSGGDLGEKAPKPASSQLKGYLNE